VYAKSNNGAGIEQQKASMIQNQKSAASGRNVIEGALKKASDIKDTRSKIF